MNDKKIPSRLENKQKKPARDQNNELRIACVFGNRWSSAEREHNNIFISSRIYLKLLEILDRTQLNSLHRAVESFRRETRLVDISSEKWNKR